MNHILSAVVIASVLFSAAPAGADDRPIIHVPADHQRLGDPGDPLCPAESGPCFRITAKGTVPPGLHAYFAVEPLDDPSPLMWLTPVPSIDSDGSVRSVIQFGEADNGAEQEFEIRLLACHDRETLRRKHTITSIPPDCLSSDAITIYRVR